MISRLLFLLCWGILSCSPAPSSQQIQTKVASLQHILQQSEVSPDSIRILISKPDYRLQVLAGDRVIRTYPVVFGGNPTDDKLRQGDQCTPEGIFRIRDAYPHKKWSYFLWIDYPTEVSWRNHRAAKEAGLISEDVDIGGEIGIHGVPEGYDHVIAQRQNWTLGCISLRTADIQELYDVVKVGMVVEIVGE